MDTQKSLVNSGSTKIEQYVPIVEAIRLTEENLPTIRDLVTVSVIGDHVEIINTSTFDKFWPKFGDWLVFDGAYLSIVPNPIFEFSYRKFS